MSRVFVTGTDTGVGKTVASAVLAIEAARAGESVGYLKPAQTGVAPGSGQGDASFVAAACKAAGVRVECDVAYELLDALAPAVAAEREGVELSLDEVLRRYGGLAERHETVIVEGAGGLLVPFNAELLMADVADALGLAVIVVARPGLGTLNSTRLTVEAARVRGLEVEGIIVSGASANPGLAEETNLGRLADFAGAPLLRVIGEMPGLDVDRSGEVGVFGSPGLF